MKYTGTFNTYNNNDQYTVTIGDGNDITTILDPSDAEIYSDSYNKNKIMFGESPVTISASRQDLIKRILISQCTISLVSDANLTSELFASNDRTIPVKIEKGNTIVFYGFVDPLQFDQGYAHKWEEVEISATDPLGALEDLDVGALLDRYGISAATIIEPSNLLNYILYCIDISPTHLNTNNVNADVKYAFEHTRISMSQFFGKTEDNYKSLQDVLEVVLKYFNMYLCMQGTDPCLFCTINQDLTTTNITSLKNYAKDEDTSISIDDIYSQVKVTCNIEPVKDPIVTTGDENSYRSEYKNMQRYMTELVCPGEGKTAHNAFTDLLLTGGCNYDKSYTIENYFYLLENVNFDFGEDGYTQEDFWTDAAHHDQREALIWLADTEWNSTYQKEAPLFRSAFCGFGRGAKITNGISDNSPMSSMTLDKWLIISCMGDYDNNPDIAKNITGPAIRDAAPLCRYLPLNSIMLSPTDREITNYIVITGSILLNPLQPQTGYGWDTERAKLYNTYERCRQDAQLNLKKNYWHHTVPNPDNEDGAYYTQRWDYTETEGVIIKHGVYGFLDNNKNQSLTYNYSAQESQSVWDDPVFTPQDTISKMPVIACKLQVGDKYCVERLDLGQEGIGRFDWMTQEEIDDVTGLEPYFTIGIDPKIGDNIIGQTFKIQNNKDYITGTAIPVTYDDALAGPVKFEIMGPYNAIWDNITKKTHTKFLFWDCDHWNDEKVSILNNIQSIMIKDFKIEVQSDNGQISEYAAGDDKDLIYASDTQPDYIENLEEDLDICTGLDMDECQEANIKYQISNSYVLNPQGATDLFFRGFYDDESESYIRPEQCLVDFLYKEYCSQSKIMESTVSTSILPNGPLGNKLSYDMFTKPIKGMYSQNDTNPYMIMSYETDLKMQSIILQIRETKTDTNIQFSQS